MKLRITGKPDEVREIIPRINLPENYEFTYISKEYEQKRRYNGEVSVYIDIKQKNNK